MKIEDIKRLVELINKINTERLSVNNISLLIKLQKLCKEILKEKMEIYDRILKDYEITSNSGIFDWSNHEKSEEISNKIKKVTDSKNVLTPVNFITETELFSGTIGFKIEDLILLSDILVSK